MTHITRKDIEIMSPVGSYESLMAAIKSGADSVYFGIEMLNMRARSANNFTIQDLAQIVQICNEHGVKSYLTVNIVIYDSEMETMQKVIQAAKDYNVTAIIASDIAAIQYARQLGVEVHISTQLNVSNVEALKFFAEYADVVVLARELNLRQVSYIHKQIHEQNITGPSGELVKLEMFVHGALCMAVSGKCYLSLHEQNSSANKGACMLTCRKAYVVTEKESGNQLEIDNEYIMSPKDLNAIGFIDELIDAGVRVLKIEGRARGPEYVKIVTEAYNEAVEAILQGNYDQAKAESLKERLSQVFNRGFWDGYYLGQKLGEWTNNYGSSSTKIKHMLGKCTNYFSQIEVGEFLMQSSELSVGDEVLIIGKTTGVLEFKIEELRVDLESVQTVRKGEVFSMKVPELVRRGDTLYIWVDKQS